MVELYWGWPCRFPAWRWHRQLGHLCEAHRRTAPRTLPPHRGEIAINTPLPPPMIVRALGRIYIQREREMYICIEAQLHKRHMVLHECRYNVLFVCTRGDRLLTKWIICLYKVCICSPSWMRREMLLSSSVKLGARRDSLQCPLASLLSTLDLGYLEGQAPTRQTSDVKNPIWGLF